MLACHQECQGTTSGQLPAMDWIEVDAQVRIFVTFSGPRKGEGGLRGEIEGGMGDQSPSAPVIIGGALHHYQVPPLTPIYSGANVRH